MATSKLPASISAASTSADRSHVGDDRRLEPREPPDHLGRRRADQLTTGDRVHNGFPVRCGKNCECVGNQAADIERRERLLATIFPANPQLIPHGDLTDGSLDIELRSLAGCQRGCALELKVVQDLLEFDQHRYSSSSATAASADVFEYSVTRPSKKFCSLRTSISSASHGSGFSGGRELFISGSSPTPSRRRSAM